MNRKQIIVITILTILLVLKILFKPSPIIFDGLSPVICPEAKYFFKTDKPLIALTIDDIPDDNHFFPHTTLGILDVLASYQIKATFFVITNKAANFPALIESIVEQGHELGNHLTDDELSIKPEDKFETEFIKADRFLSQFANVRWFRPGDGRCNSKMTKIVEKYNYEIALGSFWSYVTSNLSPEFSSWYIKQNIRPGSIIILHDSNDQSDRRGENTIQVLNKIIPQLRQRGYRFVTLSELEQESD